MQKTISSEQIRKLALLGMLTALVILFQFIGAFIKFGVFSVSLVLVPIVIGAALCGPLAGGWLGLVFGAIVLMSGDAVAFLAVNVFGTIFVVFVKGILAGVAAGWAFKLVNALKLKGGKYIAAFASAVVVPVVNTGIFLIGCFAFFYDTVAAWASALGYENTAAYMFLGLVGANFLFELLLNVVLAPVIVRIIDIAKKTAK